MPRYRVLPYRQGSRGAKALANALPRGRVLKLQGSTFTPRNDDIVINWGNTQGVPPGVIGRMNLPVCTLYNWPEDILNASNKLNFFQLMREEGHDNIIPPFWTNQEEIPDEAFPIVCRTTLAGHSGAGIVIAGNRRDLVNAPLYVKYIKKQQEYRIHVGRREEQSIIIAMQRKARRLEVPDERVNWSVRNHDNGFIFAREGFVVPNVCQEAATLALAASGLDFGAVDVIYNERSGRAYVLEINTAPGLEGQTIQDYANFFTGG
jgi:hypothetical protein